MKFIIENGGQVNIPLFNTGFSISGVFVGATNTFDPGAAERFCIRWQSGSASKAFCVK
ncbi:MAG: hypothetical protein LBD91_00375 [Prevotellaceae bacterium]|jgi:hypothetical protein|nr:hypothetical protein [Prevotellaceae bacterium]